MRLTDCDLPFSGGGRGLLFWCDVGAGKGSWLASGALEGTTISWPLGLPTVDCGRKKELKKKKP